MPDVNHIVTGSDGSTNAGDQGGAPGTKTDPTLLLASLQEEREKRRQAEDAKSTAEAELKKLQDVLASGDTLSEEGKILKTQIDDLQGKLFAMTEKETLNDLQTKFPALKDKSSEFKEFKKKYPEGNDESVAKIFLAENNLLDAPTTRKGVEKPSGGGRTAQKTGMTFAEADELRRNNFRKYSQLLKEGKLNDLIP